MLIVKKLLLALCFVYSSSLYAQPSDYRNLLNHLRAPVGFELSVYADNLPDARSLALGDNGIVFVGSGQEGAVYAVQDSDHDGVADKRYVIAEGLYLPNGVAFRDDTLFVAEVNRIIRFDHITEKLTNPPKAVAVYDRFPSDPHHGWKYLRFGPDNKLYTSVGAPCNVCEPKQAIFSSLVRLNPDGSGLEILAKGIRSSVGLDWQPESGDLFFTDNGRDYLGDDLPPDELNRWTKAGQHFGFPYCHGGYLPDPEFSANNTCRQFSSPEWQFKAHMAPLGLRFYRGVQFPTAYQNQLFVAEHGSWNRSEPQGYRVAMIKFAKQNRTNGNSGKDSQSTAVAEQVFIDGWLQANGDVLGRPVDILEMPDGSLLISDDKLGLIYRVEYKGEHE